MDPELIEELRKALTAHRRGVSTARVDSVVNERTEFGSLRELASHAREQGVPREELEQGLPSPGGGQQASEPQPSEEGGGGLLGSVAGHARNVRDMATLGTEGITLGTADELAGGLAGAAAAVVPGGDSFSEAYREARDAHRQSVESARENLGPVIGTASEIAGGVATGVAAGGLNLIRGGGGLLARTARSGLLGAGEAAAYGAGSAEGGFEARSEAALDAAKIGGPLGAAIPGGAALARQGTKAVRAGAREVAERSTVPADALGLTRLGRNTRRAEARTGPQTAEELRRVSDVEGRPSRVRSEVEEARSGIYSDLDEIENIDDPQLREILQSDEVAPYVDEAIASGQEAPAFVDAQGAYRQLRQQARAAARNGDAASYQKLKNAERRVRRRLREVLPEAAEADAQYATQLRRLDALEEGEATVKGTADEFEDAWNSLGDSEQERASFREGALSWYLERFDDIKAMKSTLERIQHGESTRRKLRILLGSDEALEEFTDVARNAERIRNRAKQARTIRRFLLPILGGSALGGAGASLLN